jgi:hypothetical protein
MGDFHPGTSCGELDAGFAASGCSVRVITIDRLSTDPRTGASLWTPLRRIVFADDPAAREGPLLRERRLDLSSLTPPQLEVLLALLSKARVGGAASAAPAPAAPSTPRSEPELEDPERRRPIAASPGPRTDLSTSPPPIGTGVAVALARNRLRAAERGWTIGGSATTGLRRG